MRYVTGEFEGYGGPHLYVTEVKASLIVDLRPCEEYEKLRSVVIDLVGFDLNDLPIDLGYYHDLFREVAPIARARGFQWLAFCDEYPFSNVEEWLYLGSDPLPVREIETD
ncbi:hypothetical protein SAMN05216275_1534 [Streptosporangium canum]|uniref:Uncharacterized protein n=1 Tax=Streptosporangium canum TaxID=324952 RepID=A0A1I4EWE7_9ACTN|nr:hypothetical protein [Streptosporangium canum]SFL08856.1 hypothetical protein SAMN05216275_1534 [Streptosporangium canum]